MDFYPNKNVILTLGSKYEGDEDGYEYNVNGFAGYSAEHFRVGAEGFFQPKVFDDGRDGRRQDYRTIYPSVQILIRSAQVQSPGSQYLLPHILKSLT